MTTLKFANTHNMVAFLVKPAESEGFEQIVDFLNAHTIKYALTINPTIYTSCIEQFWATVKAKIINGKVQLQALVDGKKIIITKSIVRRDLQIEDAEGVDCLPNATIFEQLTLMRYEKISQKLTFYKAFFSPQWKFLIHTILQCLSSKTTAWNKFSSTMASAIICLATNQKFNFLKYIFESMVNNLDNVGFSGSHTFISNHGGAQSRRNGQRPKRKDTEVPQPSGLTTNVADEAINKEMDDSLVTPNKPSSPGTSSGGGPRPQETMGDTITQTRSENVSKLSNDPLFARGLKRRVKKLERRNKSRTHGLKRLYKVGSSRRVESSDKEGLGEEDASKHGRITDIDANKYIYLVSDHTDEDMFGVNDLDGDEVIVENVDVVKIDVERRSVVEEVTVVIEKAKLVSVVEETVNDVGTTISTAITILVSAATTTTTTTTTVSDVEITLAQALAELKSAASTRPKVKGIVIHEQEQAPTPTVSSQEPSLVKVQDKGKGKMVEPEPVKKMSKKDLLMLDEELAFKLQAEEEKEEERLAREKA
ncbi:hypothetical protein Tco_1400503 [Tanacetum coccineum]